MPFVRSVELRGAILDWPITCDEAEQTAPRWCDA